MGSERREHPRIPAEIAIRVRFTDGRSFEDFYLRDISRGGIFLQAKNLRPLRSQLAILLALPNGKEVTLRGEVVHVVTPEQAGPDRPSGMGIQFQDLAPEVKRELEEFIDRLAKRSLFPTGRAKQPAPAASPAPLREAPSRPESALPDGKALLRRLCFLLAEGGIMGRPIEEIAGVARGAPLEMRQQIYARLLEELRPNDPPAHLGEEEVHATLRTLEVIRRALGV